jgi:hypothetical protein
MYGIFSIRKMLFGLVYVLDEPVIMSYGFTLMELIVGLGFMKVVNIGEVKVVLWIKSENI